MCPGHLSGPCKAASPGALLALAHSSQTSHYQKGSSIVHQDEDYSQIGIILSGVVKQTNVAADGRQTVVALLEEGAVIGNISSKNSRFAYEAASSVSVCLIPQKVFSRLLHEFPELACHVLEMSARQSEEILEWLTLFNCRTTLERLSGYLHALFLSQRMISRNPTLTAVRIPIGRKDLSCYLGTTPETLSRNFHRLSALGVLKIVDGANVEIINPAKLSRIAGETSGELRSISHGRDKANSSGLIGDAPALRSKERTSWQTAEDVATI